MLPIKTIAVALLAGAALAGCASTTAEPPPSLISDSPPPAPATTGAIPARAGSYQLSAEEQKYDCRKLTGLMQIRILQVRGYDSNRKASMAARGMHSGLRAAC